jgi:hypothetical protein
VPPQAAGNNKIIVDYRTPLSTTITILHLYSAWYCEPRLQARPGSVNHVSSFHALVRGNANIKVNIEGFCNPDIPEVIT